MPFSVIDATGSVDDCEAQIAHELRYQSSLDLDGRTYARITTLPLAREVVAFSRKALVQRLDDYCLFHTSTFQQACCPFYPLLLPCCALSLSVTREAAAMAPTRAQRQ